jgi:NADPH:quinone reductase-like Zn-dependent oxidoreductase
MKAIVQERFGPPDSWRLVDTDIPAIGPQDVLVRVRAAALNPYDWHMLRGDPRIARLFGVGLTRPKHRIAGIDGAGVVESVGADVSAVEPGDEVLGFCHGSFAEYAQADADRLVPKPAGMSFEQAAALPMAGSTALRGIRETGEVSAGQRVLVNGAGGGIGTFAVQIAVALGAEVTGVCSTGNVDLVRSLGAAHVVDYTVEDFTADPGAGRGPYDVILDNVGNHPLSTIRRSLTPTGILVLNGGGSPGRVIGAVGPLLQAAAVDRFVTQRLRQLLTVQDRDELLALTAMVVAGSLRPVVERTYRLADAAAGLRVIEAGHARGKLVITI